MYVRLAHARKATFNQAVQFRHKRSPKGETWLDLAERAPWQYKGECPNIFGNIGLELSNDSAFGMAGSARMLTLRGQDGLASFAGDPG